jgi:hypothetical protein
MYTLSRHMLREIAEQLNDLAECDRDAQHVAPALLNVLRAWERQRLPGHRRLAERADELQRFVDEIPFGVPSVRELRAEKRGSQ